MSYIFFMEFNQIWLSSKTMERWLQCVYTHKRGKNCRTLLSKAAKHDKKQGMKCEDTILREQSITHFNWESYKLLVENTEEMVGSAVLSIYKSKLDAIWISGKKPNKSFQPEYRGNWPSLNKMPE